MPSALRRGGGAAPVLARSTPEEAVYKVLCVEDNEDNLMLVQDIVARHPGLELLTARDGKAGIDVAREQVPDVILMDISLPDISGLQVLKLLALDAVTAHIPVIALSANAMPHDIAAGFESGFFDYLTKPIRIEALLHTLEEALDRPRAVSTPHGNNR